MNNFLFFILFITTNTLLCCDTQLTTDHALIKDRWEQHKIQTQLIIKLNVMQKTLSQLYSTILKREEDAQEGEIVIDKALNKEYCQVRIDLTALTKTIEKNNKATALIDKQLLDIYNKNQFLQNHLDNLSKNFYLISL